MHMRAIDTHAIASTGPDMRTRTSEADALPPDVASMLVDLRRDRRASANATASYSTVLGLARSLAAQKDVAVERAADTDAHVARVLARIGPQVDGFWRYSCVARDGLLTVATEPADQFAHPGAEPPAASPDGAHAAYCEVREDDGSPD